MKDFKLVVNEEETKIPETLKINLLLCSTEHKKYVLLSVLTEIIKRQEEQTIVFCPTLHHCEYLEEFLKLWDVPTLSIFGKMDQEARNIHMDNFRSKKCSVLLVTDVAARGLDIPHLVAL